MKKLNDLNTLLKDNQDWMNFGCEQSEVWLENSRVERGSSEETDDGLHYLDFKYRLCASIDGLQAQKGDALIVLLHCFTNQMDDDFLGELEIDITPSDDRLVDVEITMMVNEPIYLVEVEKSPIHFNGKYWGFGEGGLTFATQVKSLNVNE
jgi:hypothetical protein